MKKFFKNIRYLFEYFVVVVIIKIIGMLGLSKSVSICSYLAKKIGPLLPVNKIAQENIQNAFGPAVNSHALVNQVWDNFGTFIGEFPYVSKMTEEELLARVEIIGLNNIEQFQQLHQPFLLFTGHFANWDFALKIANKFYHKFVIIYRKANNPYVDRIINNTRIDSNIKLIPKGPKGVRELISSIKLGYSIGMLVDQKMNDGIEVPLLEQPAMTAHAIAKIALQFDYPIIPLQIIRTQGSYFQVIIHPAIQFQKTNNSQKDCYNIMCIINDILGNWIKEYPGQWFWFHNRWKKNHIKSTPKKP
ncbi:lipid A biosynthesis lauroyl acyltransferase [Candidatus Tisiphia endosymbiont of Nemotelus uliginosus]|uniref:LpxL/LpxP family acyltransferase n=1 Tax=Candidatus Tisiphia endosymbiont of Nemotelus uliginosus TaxID=3077926 RepID=UPI0035C8EE52